MVASQNQYGFGINGVQPQLNGVNRQVTTSRVIMLLDTIKVWAV